MSGYFDNIWVVDELSSRHSQGTGRWLSYKLNMTRHKLVTAICATRSAVLS